MKLKEMDGFEIAGERVASWLTRFKYYRDPPDQAAIESWLAQFAPKDRNLAARVLDEVRVIAEKDIQKGYKLSAQQIPGWNSRNAKHARTVVVGFGRAGESGQAMLRSFREANGMSNKKYDKYFRSAIELPALGLTALDTVIFVDDFSGSGKQVVDTWPVLEELVASEAKCFLVLSAITQQAKERLKELTRLRVVSNLMIPLKDNIFSDACQDFNQAEKKEILKYCRQADKINPKGYGKCGLLYVLSHKTPNNSIPILHSNHVKWRGLFPRYLNV